MTSKPSLFSYQFYLVSPNSPENVASDKNTENGVAQAFQTIGKCSQSTFRSVTELSSGGDRLSGFAAVDVVNLVEFPFNYIILKNFC